MDYLLKEREIMTNGMIKLELLGGTKSEREFQHLENRLDALDIIDINTRLWEEAYSLSFKLRRKGLTVPYLLSGSSLAPLFAGNGKQLTHTL